VSEAPLHVSVLRALGRQLNERREQHKEHVAKGLEEREYRTTCGRIAECKAFGDLIDEMLTAIRNDELDFDEDDHD